MGGAIESIIKLKNGCGRAENYVAGSTTSSYVFALLCGKR